MTTAWLITWEGPESVHTGRCKVVAVLPPQFGETGITAMLPFLYCAGYNHTLCEKMGFSTPSRKDDRLLRIAYRDIHPEFWYGVYPKEYLCARKVKNLRCEESKIDCFENTLHWTELAKYIPNPQIDFGGPLPDNRAEWTKQVSGERDEQYTYSIWPAIEAGKARRTKQRG